MGTSNFTLVPEEGTTLNFGNWVYVVNGLGSFTSHLAAPAASKANATMRDNDPGNAARVGNSQVFNLGCV